MIDEQWFATIRCLTGTKISDEAADRLRATLGVEDEVLAYLLLRTDAFADWPNARNAFRRAVRSVIRPQPISRQVGGAADSPALRSEFAASTVASMTGIPAAALPAKAPDALPRLVQTEPPGELLRQLRVSVAERSEDPHIFIAPALRGQP
jgi:hypothetical protein